MLHFTLRLTNLQAAIALVAARERALTVLLVALWGRIGLMWVRLERLVRLWRTGCLPARQVPAGERATGGARVVYPAAPAGQNCSLIDTLT